MLLLYEVYEILAENNLNSNLSKVDVYVGEDEKLHFVDSTGADSVLPFSSCKVYVNSKNLATYEKVVLQDATKIKGVICGLASSSNPNKVTGRTNVLIVGDDGVTYNWYDQNDLGITIDGNSFYLKSNPWYGNSSYTLFLCAFY